MGMTSGSRVHTDPKAADSARVINALAYTVGRELVFSYGRYLPQTASGQKLIAHELTHVVQQAGSDPGIQAQTVLEEGKSTGIRSKATANKAISSFKPEVVHKISRKEIQCHKGDLVAYTGGQSGYLEVIQAGKSIYVSHAVSGHLGHGENEPGEGPIPSGRYNLHPGIQRPTVARIQSGVCGANGISSGYQEITSTDSSPCQGDHYCNVPCPTPSNSSQKCFTPQDCWGPMRIKIEGSATVVTPSGKTTVRDGFYLHGGNPSDAVSSGCIKTLDNGIFPEIRKLTGLKGSVPLCVGSVCDRLSKNTK